MGRIDRFHRGARSPLKSSLHMSIKTDNRAAEFVPPVLRWSILGFKTRQSRGRPRLRHAMGSFRENSILQVHA